ncbi:MAG: efflux RND transporter periplasmic adaptor subunit [Saprospiraceae bacterium]|nr:efflux RND transporter periplasmic adaptor subunit [Saprospiraceae bacterium]
MRHIHFFPVLLLFAALAACQQDAQKDDTSQTAFAFTLSDTMAARCQFYEALVEPVMVELRLFGKISADNNKVAQVYPIVGGNVLKINVEVGDYVRRGDVLAVMRSGEVAGFQKDRLNALNDVAIAEKNLQVARDMFAGKLLTEKEVIAAQRELDKARAELERVNELYSIYSLRDGSIYNITAPMNGFVLAKDINQNEQLRSDRTEPVFAIAEINEVWALANVNESDIGKVRLGIPAAVHTVSFPDDVYRGQVDKIYNTIDPETKAMKIRVKIPNPTLKLKPEMNATVNLRFPEGSSLVAVPAASIIFDKGKNWVMVYRDRSDIETRLVHLHSQVGDKAYITAGLEPGEKVISKNGLWVYDALND